MRNPGDLQRLAVTQESRDKPSANDDMKNSQMSKIMIIKFFFTEKDKEL